MEELQTHTCGVHTHSPCYHTDVEAHKHTHTSINFFSLSLSNTHIPAHIPQTHPVFNHSVMANYSVYSLCWKGQLHPLTRDRPKQTTDVPLCLQWGVCVCTVSISTQSRSLFPSHVFICVLLCMYVDFKNVRVLFKGLFLNVCVWRFVGGEPRTVGRRQTSAALIWARLHMDLIGWEIIIYWGENDGGRSERSRGEWDEEFRER